MTKVDIIFPVLPPVIDGIGDHTALLARALARHCTVRVLTAQHDCAPIAGVEVVRAFDMNSRRGVLKLADAVAEARPDWVLLQFNQYSYGRWGVNPWLPAVMRRIKRRGLARIAWLAHEDFIPIKGAKSLVFGAIQRAQFFAIGRTADVVLSTIQPWADKYASWFPKASTGVVPAGANIPPARVERAAARARLGIAEDEFVIGYFGSARVDRRVGAVAKLVCALRDGGKRLRMLYVGMDREKIRQALADQGLTTEQVSSVLLAAGALPAQEVSDTLVGADILVAPYIDGVSGRRGGFLAGLQLGIPSVSNVGPLTDGLLLGANREAFVLASDTTDDGLVGAGLTLAGDRDLQARIAASGHEFFQTHYSWASIARGLVHRFE